MATRAVIANPRGLEPSLMGTSRPHCHVRSFSTYIGAMIVDIGAEVSIRSAGHAAKCKIQLIDSVKTLKLRSVTRDPVLGLVS